MYSLYRLFNTNDFLQKNYLFWQYPVITEKEFFHQNKNNYNYIGIPWATIIDKRYNLNILYKLIKPYINLNYNYYTCCQHIYYYLLIPFFKSLNIKLVYASHKTIGLDNIDNVIIKPCPLYAVNIEDNKSSGDILER